MSTFASVVASLACCVSPPAKISPAPGVADRLAEVSPTRVKATVEKLESFGTRHTLSDTTSSTHGIGAARNWLRDELQSYGTGLAASLEEFDAPRSVRLHDGARVVNVVAVLPGTSDSSKDRAYYVAGHYDSRNGEAMDATGASPGANDDASGVAAVLECARVLAAHPCESTIVFLCTAGEEQGLVGAHFHAKALAAEGRYRLVQVLNNDIVGDPSPTGGAVRYADPAAGAEALTPLLSDLSPHEREHQAWVQAQVVRVFSEGLPRGANAEALARIRAEGAESDSPSRQIARFVSYVARREGTRVQPMLVFRQDRFLRGGDHAAFNEAGFAAVRMTVPAEDYSRQHQNVTEKDGKPYGDLASFVDAGYAANVTRLNLATLIHMANAPTPPRAARMLTSELSTDTVLRWDTSPEPDTAGYEVVYRLTTEPDWTGVIDAGTHTELRVKLSKDNVFFGVRAYDQDGFRSPVSFAWAARE
jgi:hypothetical protein